jgi:hypothetical protein
VAATNLFGAQKTGQSQNVGVGLPNRHNSTDLFTGKARFKQLWDEILSENLNNHAILFFFRRRSPGYRLFFRFFFGLEADPFPQFFQGCLIPAQ